MKQWGTKYVIEDVCTGASRWLNEVYAFGCKGLRLAGGQQSAELTGG